VVFCHPELVEASQRLITLWVGSLLAGRPCLNKKSDSSTTLGMTIVGQIVIEKFLKVNQTKN